MGDWRGICETRIRGRRKDTEGRAITRSGRGLKWIVGLGRVARNGIRSGTCCFNIGDWGTGSPQEFDETLLEVTASGDDGLDGGGPNDQYAFIPLQKQ